MRHDRCPCLLLIIEKQVIENFHQVFNVTGAIFASGASIPRMFRKFVDSMITLFALWLFVIASCKTKNALINSHGMV